MARSKQERSYANASLETGYGHGSRPCPPRCRLRHPDNRTTPDPADHGTTEQRDVQGRQVKIEVQVANWKLVDAGSPVATGEGHLHFFVDQPASAVPAGQAIPAGTAAYVHAGKAPYTSRELELTPGQHTITVVMGDSSHVALAQPTPQIVTFTVQ